MLVVFTWRCRCCYKARKEKQLKKWLEVIRLLCLPVLRLIILLLCVALWFVSVVGSQRRTEPNCVGHRSVSLRVMLSFLGSPPFRFCFSLFDRCYVFVLFSFLEQVRNSCPTAESKTVRALSLLFC